MKEIHYKRIRLSQKKISDFLFICDKYFKPQLSERVNIIDYSRKISAKAEHFVAYSNHQIIGLVACYFNDPNLQIGYITSVSVNPDYFGKGIATELLRSTVIYGRELNYDKIYLEVGKANEGAIKLYRRFGFEECSSGRDLIKMVLTLSDEQSKII